VTRPYLSEDVRRFVAQRADYLCEYCLIAENDTLWGCQVDHVISLKHGGSNAVENLAYACAFCNRQKGTDLGSIDWQTGNLVRFFNPRQDNWSEHFKLNGSTILSVTIIGEVTVRLFGFNDNSRILERQELMAENRYPSLAAIQRMKS
jgi:hypothetical protein